MNKYSLWIKIPVLVLFFGSMAGFVAFRSGAFGGETPPAGPESSVPDSPQVKTQPDPMIYSTKSGKIIEPISTPEGRKIRMSSSKSMIMVEPNPTNVSGTSAPDMPDSLRKPKPKAKKQLPKKSSKQKANSNNSNIEFRDPMPSSKSGPVLPLNE